MASRQCFVRCTRTASSILGLTNSFRAVSLSATPYARPAVQARAVSSAILPSANYSPLSRALSRHTVPLTQQQTRGMKVYSSIKKRCEHCKVSSPLGFCLRRRGRPHTRTSSQFADPYGVSAGRTTEERQEIERLPVYHLQREPSSQAATGLVDLRLGLKLETAEHSKVSPRTTARSNQGYWFVHTQKETDVIASSKPMTHDHLGDESLKTAIYKFHSAIQNPTDVANHSAFTND